MVLRLLFEKLLQVLSVLLAAPLFLKRTLAADNVAENKLIHASDERESLLKLKSRVCPIVGVLRSWADGVVGKIGL